VPGPVPVGERQDGGYYRVGDNVTITMIKGGVITGRVTNATGEPLIGVRVNAVMTRGAEGNTARRAAARPRFTDDRGFYRLYGLPPGTYVVFTRNAFPLLTTETRRHITLRQRARRPPK
jgi:Carboxypeptidase regulatory-like domain